MLAGVVGCALAVWASAVLSARARQDAELAQLQKREDVARATIALKPAVEARIKAARERVDMSKTLSADELQIEIESAAKASGLEYSLSSAVRAKSGGFSVNRLTLSTSPQNLADIVKFENLVAKLAPYATIEEVSFSGDSRTGKVSARYAISSFE